MLLVLAICGGVVQYEILADLNDVHDSCKLQREIKNIVNKKWFLGSDKRNNATTEVQKECYWFKSLGT